MSDAAALIRLRRKTERWSDFLLAQLPLEFDPERWASDSARCEEFLDETASGSADASRPAAWTFIRAAANSAFENGISETSPNARFHRRVADAVLSAFSADMFDATGPFHSLWTLRLLNTVDDVQGVVADLLDVPPPTPPSSPSRTSGHPRLTP
ncbi:MAG: hypothetical protein N2C14_12820 [Planctomycetales bacterium]